MRMKNGPCPNISPIYLKYIRNISQIYPKYIRPGNEKKVVVRMKNVPLELLDEELEPLQVFPTQQISCNPYNDASNLSKREQFPKSKSAGEEFIILILSLILLVLIIIIFIISLGGEVVELLLHLVYLPLQVGHLVDKHGERSSYCRKTNSDHSD